MKVPIILLTHIRWQHFLALWLQIKAEVLTMAYRTPDPVLPLPELLLGSSVQFSSVQPLSCVQLCDPMNCSTPSLPVHHQLWVYSNSCPLSRWCHPTISSSVVPFSSCLQSFPESGSFPMGQFFASGSQSIGVSASTSVLPMNTQNWSPLGWTGWISLLSKGLLEPLKIFLWTHIWGLRPTLGI